MERRGLRHQTPITLLFVFVVVALFGCGGSGGGDGSGSSSGAPSREFHWVEHWNRVAIDASGLDHKRPAAGENRVFGEQIGPVRAARAMAIVHIAVADSVAAISGRFTSYMPTEPAPAGTSLQAAIAQAAHDTLVAMFPSQAATFDAYLATELGEIVDGVDKENGIALGKARAKAILEQRQSDGAELSEPYAPITYTPLQDAGKWRPDPLNPGQQALGANWYLVRPFVMDSADQFRAPAPPDLGSPAYAKAYEEAKRLGGDGVTTPTERTEEQTQIGLYWAYDGTPSLCAPPRLYNQIAIQLAGERGLDAVELARLLALLNVAMADAGIAVWESKYHYAFWRPVTGIRESDPGTGPTGTGDGNEGTIGDVNFTPLGAPASNSGNLNFTPPFPAYPSGHAGFGGAIFETMRNVFGTDNVSFTFVSDELNGVTVGNDGNVRPLVPRSFGSLSEAEEENGQSRIYLGIHWSFDKTEGIAMGRRVGDLISSRIYQLK